MLSRCAGVTLRRLKLPLSHKLLIHDNFDPPHLRQIEHPKFYKRRFDQELFKEVFCSLKGVRIVHKMADVLNLGRRLSVD